MRIIIAMIAGILMASASHAAAFKLESPAYTNNGTFPDKYSCQGKNVPPPLKWENSPAGTKSFVLIFSCPDAAIGSTFYGWVVFNIPADAIGLPDKNNKMPRGIVIGDNSYGDNDYEGPCPPDRTPHHYIFTLYAIDTILYLSPGSPAEDVLDRIQDHVIDQTELTGIFTNSSIEE